MSGRSLLLLDNSGLEKMNATKVGHRLKILDMITNLVATESAAEKVESITPGQQQQWSTAWRLIRGQAIESSSITLGEENFWISIACRAVNIILGLFCLAYFITSVQTWLWQDENVSQEAKKRDQGSVAVLGCEFLLGGLLALEASFRAVTWALSYYDKGASRSGVMASISLACFGLGLHICTHDWDEEVLQSLAKYLEHDDMDPKRLPFHFSLICHLPSLWVLCGLLLST